MIEVDIAVEDQSWVSACPAYDASVRKAIAAVFEYSPVAVNLLEFGIEPEISVVLADNVTVQNLNRAYRSKDKPTNILSFAQLDGKDGWNAPEQAGPCALGDLVLAYETVRDEAAAEGKAFDSHLMHLIIHGMLHLLGYDHLEDSQAEEMESLEIQILSSISVKNPYKNS